MESINEIIESEEIVAHGIKYFYETLSNGEKRLRHYDEKYKMWIIITEAPDAVTMKEMEDILYPLAESIYFDYLQSNFPEIYNSFQLDKYHY